MDQHASEEYELRLIFVGKTGSGKSASINTLVGKKVCHATISSQSVTKKCKLIQETVHGKSLVVVDTPGLFDTDTTVMETKKEIGKMIGCTLPGFHVFVVVIRIGRFTKEEANTIEDLAKLFGPELYDRAVILFTGVDNLDADGITFEGYLGNDDTSDLQTFMKQCGDRVVLFNNRSSRPGQVESLMDVTGSIIRANGNTYYTNDMYQKAKKILEEEENKRLQGDTSKTRTEIREELRNEIAEEKSFGQILLQLLIDIVAVPIAQLLAEETAKVAKQQIKSRCIVS